MRNIIGYYLARGNAQQIQPLCAVIMNEILKRECVEIGGTFVDPRKGIILSLKAIQWEIIPLSVYLVSFVKIATFY